MRALILPTFGSVYIDANSAIYAVEKIEPYCSFLAPLWPAAHYEVQVDGERSGTHSDDT